MAATKKNNDVLYGNEISRKRKEKLGDQLYEAFLREITCGRWSVGERLPSYQELAKMSGLSRTPIEATLTRLEEEGYITKIKKKGIFLKSRHPGGHVNLGTVAIIVSKESMLENGASTQKTQSFGLWEVDTIKAISDEIGLNLMVIPVNGDKQDTRNRLRTIITRSDFRGVISMVEPKVLKDIYPVNEVRTVYLGFEDPICTPCVAGNPCKAMYILTDYLIRQGHKKIAVFMSQENNPEAQIAILNGHRRAMEEAGLAYNAKAIEFSSAIEFIDVSSVKKYLEICPDITAVIGTTINSSRKIVETADLLEITVPEKLVVCSLQAGVMQLNSGEVVIDGITYDWSKIIITCFESLLDAEKFKSMSRLVFEPELHLGKKRKSM